MDTYVKIYDWMLELGLNGRELNALAVITSFGKDGEWFQGSASYLGRWLGVSKKETVRTALGKLVEKGLIEKRERWEKGKKYCDYRPVRKTAHPGPKIGLGDGPKIGPHINRPDIDSDKKKEIYKERKLVHLTVDEFLSSHR